MHFNENVANLPRPPLHMILKSHPGACFDKIDKF